MKIWRFNLRFGDINAINSELDEIPACCHTGHRSQIYVPKLAVEIRVLTLRRTNTDFRKAKERKDRTKVDHFFHSTQKTST